MSGDRNNSSPAPERRQSRSRRAAHRAALAAGVSLAALGFAFVSLPAHGDSAAPASPAAAASTPATRPAAPADAQAQQAARPIRGSGITDGNRPGGGGARQRDGRPTTGPAAIDAADIPWDEIAAFMRQHSPLKWERWEQYDQAYGGGGGPGASRRAEMRQRVQDGIRDQYAQLKKIESADPDEYKLLVRRVKLEDDVFGAQVNFLRGAGDAAKQARATQQARQNVRELLILQDELRLHRLQRRKSALADQSEQVEKQLARTSERIAQGPKDPLVNNLANRLLTEQPASLWDAPGGGRGPRSGGQPRRDGAPQLPDGREPRSDRAGPTTNRSGDGNPD